VLNPKLKLPLGFLILDSFDLDQDLDFVLNPKLKLPLGLLIWIHMIRISGARSAASTIWLFIISDSRCTSAAFRPASSQSSTGVLPHIRR